MISFYNENNEKIELNWLRKFEDTKENMGNYACYGLFVDDELVTYYNVDFIRRAKYPKFNHAEIEYENIRALDERYSNKGYTTLGLALLTNYLIANDLIPYINLSIHHENKISQNVAKGAGYVEMPNGAFEFHHPNSVEMYKESLSYLKKVDVSSLILLYEKDVLYFRKHTQPKIDLTNLVQKSNLNML